VLLTIAAFGWAGNAIVGRAAREVVPPLALSFWRWALALVILLPFAWPHLRRDWQKLTDAWKVMLPMGLLGIGTFNSLLYTGLSTTTALNGLLIQSAQPAVILALGALLMGDQVGRWQLLGLLLSLLGVSTIVTQGHPQLLLSVRLNMGDAVIGIALIAWGIYSVLLRKRPAVHPLSFTAATIMIGLLLVAPAYALEMASGQHIRFGWSSMLSILYVGIFPSVIAYTLFNRGVELLGSAQAGLFMNVMPVIGAGLAIMFLGEQLHAFHLVGLTLVLTGIAAARRGA
jgi:drug/metabolite transporter (DMT)-like permease